MRYAKRWMAGILAALLSACPTPKQPTTVTATIGGNGGRIEATSNGGVVALEFPAGAVKQNLEVKLTPLTPSTETLASFRVEPGGTFLRQPVALKFTSSQLPAGASFFWALGANRRAFPSTRNGDTLNAQIRSLGYQAAQQGQLRNLAEGDGNLEVGVLNCSQRIPVLQRQLRDVVNGGNFAQATILLDELEAVMLACQQQEIAALQQAACQEYRGAEQTARVVAADTYETFRQLVVALIAGQTSVQLTGAECDTSGFSGLFDAKLNQFLDFLDADYSRPSFAQEFNQAAARIQELLQYEANCQAMTDSGPICSRFGSQLYPPMLDKLRLAAYRMCRQGDLLTLSQMHNEILPQIVIGQQLRVQTEPAEAYLNYARFTYGDLEVDLAHCKSNLNVKVYDDATTLPEELQDQRRELQGGNQPGTHTTSATVQVPRDGSLVIDGTVKALVCPNASLSDDALVFRVGNTVVAQRPRNGDRFSLDTAPADLVVERVFTAAGLPANTNSFAVDVFREGPACGGLFRDALKLYTINVRVATGCTAPAGVKYCVTNLGTLGGTSSVAYGINNNGQAVGQSLISNSQARAFLWENGQMKDLGTLGGVGSFAFDINNNGQVVGYSVDSSGTTGRAFLWQNGQMTNLGTLGGNFARANGINNNGQVVGVSTDPGTGLSRAFLWQNGQMTGLATTISEANAINAAGHVVGYFRDSGSREQAFIWRNGQITDLGTLPGGGVNSGVVAYDMNDNGQVVGAAVLNNQQQPFFWQNGTMTALGTLSGGGRANGINAAGQVVGQSGNSSSPRAVVWQNGTITDLNTQIDPSSGLILREAFDVNDQGQIVGMGLSNNGFRAFLLTPAQP